MFFQAEDLIVQLFDLVNEKNELFRRQTELMYMKRDHRLEEEHADIEHQVRITQSQFWMTRFMKMTQVSL